jgi:flagellar biosynthesis component FlhA
MSALQPEVREAFVKSLHRSLPVMREYNWEPIILCRSEVARYLIKTVAEIEQNLPNLVVLSSQEIVNDVTLEIVGGITLEH